MPWTTCHLIRCNKRRGLKYYFFQKDVDSTMCDVVICVALCMLEKCVSSEAFSELKMGA